MNTLTIEQASNALNEAVANIGGIDAAMAACDRMYSASFRGEAATLKEMGEFGEDFHGHLYVEAAIALYSKATGDVLAQDEMPHWSERDEEDDHMYDQWADSLGYEEDAYNDRAEAWMKLNHPDFVIDENTLVVDFCNYKGEGEGGLGLYQLHKHLPVFKSKSHSFNQANNF